VIIPTFNEELRIAAHLKELRNVPGLYEIIVVDGASGDGTARAARSFAEVKVICAPQGRARQLNAGAAQARGEVLLFLHADVSLPADAARWINRTLENPTVVAGAFRTRTCDDNGTTSLGPLLRLADLRSRFTRLPYGDQAVFVRADVFRQVGGFPDWPLLEDLELSRRLRRVGPIRTVPASVRVSGRRFAARPVFYALFDLLSPTLHRMGVPLRRLADIYGQVR
jgi:rSAM/selenodomain-associated transferase 2